MMLTLLFTFSILGLELSLKQEAVTRKNDIYLSDVLSSPSLEKVRARGIRDLTVASAPGFNRDRIIQRNHVANAIRNAYPGADLEWSGPERVKVKREARRFSESALEDAIREWVAARSPHNGELRVDRVLIPRISGLPSGKVHFDIRQRGTQNLVGRRSLYVDLVVDSRVFKTLAVQVQTSLEVLVAKVVTEIARGTPLDESHIEWEYQRLDRLNTPLVTPEHFEGLRARTLLRAGMILDRRKVETVPLVERNKMVYVVARNGGLVIRMKVLAMDSGGAGDRIRLKNVDSGQILAGRVEKNGEVSLQML